MSKILKPKRAPKEPTPEEKGREYSERLAELQRELSAHATRKAGTPQSALPSLTRVEAGKIGHEAVIQFVHRGKVYAVGHTDVTFAGTNGARGIRRIHFYDSTKTIVLGIAGEFDNHALGSNFRSPELKTLHGGEWEASFLLMTTGLRTFRADRKEELRQIRAKAISRRA